MNHASGNDLKSIRIIASRKSDGPVSKVSKVHARNQLRTFHPLAGSEQERMTELTMNNIHHISDGKDLRLCLNFCKQYKGEQRIQ